MNEQTNEYKYVYLVRVRTTLQYNSDKLVGLP